MDFDLSGEQAMLKDVVRRYLRDSYGFDVRRERLRSGKVDAVLWRDFAETLGLLGAPLPEAAGGLGGGALEVMVVMEALGEALVTEPFLETVVVAGGLLKRLDSAGARTLLARIATGEARLAVAHGEAQSRYALNDVRTTARAEGSGWVLDGAKSVVVAAPGADRLIVSARTGGGPRDRDGISLFLLDPSAEGVEPRDYRLIDERPAADLMLRGVRLPGDALLSGEGDALPLLETVMDEAVAAICAEGVGVARRLLSDTIDYTKQRRQFGQPLAGFQALQHRMVDMYMAVEQAIAATYLATLKLGEAPPARARAVSAAKATLGETLRFVGQNAVQLHGAMGMTEELAVGHYFKRATVIAQQFGTVDVHLARYAGLSREDAA